MKRLRGLILLAIYLSFTAAFGQIYKYIGLDDGLSSRNVYAVQQANGGFMWFLTDNGIDRYDGSNMTKYTIRIAGQKFTEYSTCRLIYDAADDNILVVTGLGRVLQYDRRDNAFRVMYSPTINASKADIAECARSPIDEKGNIWILIGDEAFCYNVRTQQGKRLALTSNGIAPSFSAVTPKDSATLYIGNKQGVCIGHVDGDRLTLEAIPEMGGHEFNVNTLFAGFGANVMPAPANMYGARRREPL